MPLELGKNTYATIAVADAYHAERGNASWPETPAVNPEAIIAKKEAALIKATGFIDGVGAGHWRGKRSKLDQRLAWPRKDVVDADGYPIDDDELPFALQYATCEAALRVIQGVDLQPDLERGGGIKQETVGPISTVYFDNAPAETKISVIEHLLYGLVESPLFDSGRTVNGSVRMVRA